nr:MAG TPA_asm: hypothetical protein [Caudoviricetes sp.]
MSNTDAAPKVKALICFEFLVFITCTPSLIFPLYQKRGMVKSV